MYPSELANQSFQGYPKESKTSNTMLGEGAIPKGSEILSQLAALETLLAENAKLADILSSRIAPILDMQEKTSQREPQEPPVQPCISSLGERLQNLVFTARSNNRQFTNILSRIQL